MNKYNFLLRAICLFLLSYIFGVLVYGYINKETPSAIDVYRGRYDDRSELARLKLIQIYKASNILNDNWKLTPLGTQCAFYPSFMWKEGKLVCGDICHTLYGVSYDPKLCCGKEDDAFYIGTHFIDLYRDYLLLE